MTIKVHYFNSSAAAYDAAQSRDDIKDGDVLIVKSEKIAGFLMQAWPVAVTAARGEFHRVRPDVTRLSLNGGDKYATSWTRAEEIAKEFSWPLGGGGLFGLSMLGCTRK